MRERKKPFRFYLIIFIFSTILVAGYSLYMIFIQDQTVADVYMLWIMPFLFTGIYYGTDALSDKFRKRKHKVDYEAKFLSEISARMRESDEFVVEEFRKLQINHYFQEDLKKAYSIYKNKEDKESSIGRLEKKYRKDSLEKRAMKFVIDYLRENQEIPESD